MIYQTRWVSQREVSGIEIYDVHLLGIVVLSDDSSDDADIVNLATAERLAMRHTLHFERRLPVLFVTGATHGMSARSDEDVGK